MEKPLLHDKDNEPYLAIFDIRNKMSPITFLLYLYENPHLQDRFPEAVEKAKKNINYICDREVYTFE